MVQGGTWYRDIYDFHCKDLSAINVRYVISFETLEDIFRSAADMDGDKLSTDRFSTSIC